MNTSIPRSLFYKLAKEVCKKDMIEELNEKEKRTIGQRLLYMCFQHGASTGIHEKTTYGYGELDNNGFFEFPITEADLKKMKAGTL